MLDSMEVVILVRTVAKFASVEKEVRDPISQRAKVALDNRTEAPPENLRRECLIRFDLLPLLACGRRQE